jgi:uncharacterized repeat protein (TIGR02543 family)
MNTPALRTRFYKKATRLTLCALLAVSLFTQAALTAPTAAAETPATPASSFDYSEAEHNVVINGYTGADTTVVVPATINGKPVTFVGLSYYGAKITALDVSACTQLDTLFCPNNRITTLDLTKNINLVELICCDNSLTTLKMTPGKALKELDCSGNKLTALDVTENVNLVSLSCSNNKLTALDVTKNANLISLSCSNNKLTALDLTRNAKLTSLNCQYNNLYLSNASLIALIKRFRESSILPQNGIFMNVKTPSQEEIRRYLRTNNVTADTATKYASKPAFKKPYKAGKLTKTSLKSALKMLNNVRYIAGIDHNVKLDTAYTQKAQAASLVNAANNELSHFPRKPAGMAKSLYNLGVAGAASSNLGMGYSNLNQAILHGWMADEDSSNIDRIGHRRWILNPAMARTGFGSVGAYTAHYVFDEERLSAYHSVAWPAQNMPLEYFGNDYPWSVSTGTPLAKKKVTVALKRKSDAKTWRFSSAKSDGYFNVDNDNYGKTGCIIFRPESITYKAGDVFDVTITGENDARLTYTVKFFSVYSALTYKANGGKGAPAKLTQFYGKTVKLSSKKPTRKGYTFLGWSTNKKAKKAAYKPKQSFILNKKTTLYAVWKKK